jgi:hypothetical protein
MTSPKLERLARAGELKTEAVTPLEVRRQVDRAAGLLADSRRTSLAAESRFNLLYGAAFAAAAAALAAMGYRSRNRYLVFQCLEESAQLPAAQWRLLALLHERRNQAEYEGTLQVEDALLEEAARIVALLIERVSEGP